ncbi:hypothetical protein [Psychrobacter sp. FDAARGOS_221]|uniref:hypothetical protein n=1 Tax=Psychrobacter sp. FDAARGOS_221 TaxID=1975705 RepID=UPI000BB53CE7|nr:hypothetical protein [Psychrobacter sp. FDAARGOS_221]PNK61162.1 hypothetical protein A6J60_009965 [Psychrobacter sp. FDAARGOS_221]
MNRRKFLTFTVASSLMITGCQSTRPTSLSQMRYQGKKRTVQDTIRAFMITEKKDTLLVLGDTYHYIFPPDKNPQLHDVITLLSSSLREVYQVDITDSEIFHNSDPSQAVTKLSITVPNPNQLTPAQQQQYLNLRKCAQSVCLPDGSERFAIELKGDVYAATNVAKNAIQTYHSYPITITEYSVPENIKESPIRMLGEGLGLGLYILIVLPMMLIACSRNTDCYA